MNRANHQTWKKPLGPFGSTQMPLLIIAHTVILLMALWLSFCLRFDFEVPSGWRDVFWIMLPWLLAIQLSCLGAFGSLNSSRENFSCREVIYPLLLAFWIFVMVDLFFFEVHIPRAVHLLDLLIATGLVVSLRSVMRVSRKGIPA